MDTNKKEYGAFLDNIQENPSVCLPWFITSDKGGSETTIEETNGKFPAKWISES